MNSGTQLHSHGKCKLQLLCPLLTAQEGRSSIWLFQLIEHIKATRKFLASNITRCNFFLIRSFMGYSVF